MQIAPIRFANAVLWPVAIWFSLNHLDEHPADDYVERTSPIAAFAIGFWVIVAALAGLWFVNGSRRMFEVLMFFLPVVYVIGFWMFTARDEKFPR